MIERTLSILKPDVLKANIIGKVIHYIEQAGLKVVAAQSMLLTTKQAAAFYSIHKERPFFNDLIKFMSSGTLIVQVLEGYDAVVKYRDIMGDTDPKKAKKGTIRGDFAKNIDANCVHGSDSNENAALEIQFFFPGLTLIL